MSLPVVVIDFVVVSVFCVFEAVVPENAYSRIFSFLHKHCMLNQIDTVFIEEYKLFTRRMNRRYTVYYE